MSEPESLARRLQVQLGSKVSSSVEVLGETTIEVLPENLLSVARTLRDDPAWQFEQCVDVCGVDYLSYGQTEWDTTDVTSEGFSRGVEGKGAGRFDWANRPRDTAMPRRFAVVAHLLSISHNHRLRLRTFCADDDVPSVPSLVEIWPAVNWFEREAFDLFGIVFEGHPDLRRILTDYGFIGHPFRKDFPVSGNVEMRYDVEQQRVVYQPVTIEPREVTPRVVREEGYGAGR